MPEFAFVTEYTVGHVTFERLLREAAAADPTIGASWFPMTFPPRGLVEHLPALRSNRSLRSSFRARRLLTMHRRPWDALLFHTLTASLLSPGIMRQIPTVISLDGTPSNLDEVAAGYQHVVGGRRAEAAKRRIVGRSLHAASRPGGVERVGTRLLGRRLRRRPICDSRDSRGHPSAPDAAGPRGA